MLSSFSACVWVLSTLALLPLVAEVLSFLGLWFLPLTRLAAGRLFVFQKVVLWFKLVVSPLTLCCFWGHSLLGLALASILGSAHKEPATE